VADPEDVWSDDELEPKPEVEDLVERPPDAKSPLGPGSYDCDSFSDVWLAHEVCIRLAAAWAKESHPKVFPKESNLDPAKFLWDDIGPVCDWFCDASARQDHDAARAYRARSKAAKQAAGNPTKVDIAKNFTSEKFKYGYDPDDKDAFRWLDGCGQEYEHEKEYGVAHLKRPDRFPELHELPVDTPTFPSSSAPFPFHLPAEVVLKIVEESDDDTLNALERTSRGWRDFLRCRFAQRYVWLARLSGTNYTPTDADWTRSAEAVRQALATPERRASIDWRRYLSDCDRSLNLKNRQRIYESVWAISHWLDHCGCAKGLQADD
jgi:hypothetical protein